MTAHTPVYCIYIYISSILFTFCTSSRVKSYAHLLSVRETVCFNHSLAVNLIASFFEETKHIYLD